MQYITLFTFVRMDSVVIYTSTSNPVLLFCMSGVGAQSNYFYSSSDYLVYMNDLWVIK